MWFLLFANYNITIRIFEYPTICREMLSKKRIKSTFKWKNVFLNVRFHIMVWYAGINLTIVYKVLESRQLENV